MSRRRFFILKDQIRDGAAVLAPEQAHHLRDVLRLSAGDEVEVFDGEGHAYSGRVKFLGKEIHIASLARLDSAAQPGTSFVLAAALIKLDRFEWMLQKGTELGVDQFLPLETHFCSVHIPASRLEARLERWRRILREASRQSRRHTVPKIQPPLAFDSLLASTEHGEYARFMFHERASGRLNTVDLTSKNVLLCVGPEGGWDETETRAAEEAGFRIVSIGPRVLRAETAALAASAILQFLLDNPRR